MRNVKNVTVGFVVERLYGRFYDPINKIEGEGEIKEPCIPIGNVERKRFHVYYKVPKSAVEETGERFKEIEI